MALQQTKIVTLMAVASFASLKVQGYVDDLLVLQSAASMTITSQHIPNKFYKFENRKLRKITSLMDS
jgi:uncharacterized membrane protein YkvA (DUF1232 family)